MSGDEEEVTRVLAALLSDYKSAAAEIPTRQLRLKTGLAGQRLLNALKKIRGVTDVHGRVWLVLGLVNTRGDRPTRVVLARADKPEAVALLREHYGSRLRLLHE